MTGIGHRRPPSASACFVGCLVVAVPQVLFDHDDAHRPVEVPAVELVRGCAPREGVRASGVPAVGCLAAPRDHLGCRAVAADEDPQPRITGLACRRDRCLGGAVGRVCGWSRFSSPSFLVPGGEGCCTGGRPTGGCRGAAIWSWEVSGRSLGRAFPWITLVLASRFKKLPGTFGAADNRLNRRQTIHYSARPATTRHH